MNIALAVIVVALSFHVGAFAGWVNLALLTILLIANRGSQWPLPAFLVSGALLWPLSSQTWTVIAAVSAGGLAVAAVAGSRNARFVSAIVAVGSAVLAAFDLPTLIPALLLASLAYLVMSSGWVHARADADIPFKQPGSPPSTIPLLVRILKRRDISRVPPEINRKFIGANGERSTAMRLLGLQGRKVWGIRLPARAIAFHDIASLDPNRTEANLDHLVLTETGVFVLDTKVFPSGSAVFVDSSSADVRLRTRGETRSLMKLLRSLASECIAAREILQFPVQGMLVVHGASVPRGLSVRFTADGIAVEIIHQQDLIGRLDPSLGPPLSRKQFANLLALVRSVPSARGGKARPARPLPVRIKGHVPIHPPRVASLALGDLREARRAETASASPNTAPRPVAVKAASSARVDPLTTRWAAMQSSVPLAKESIPDESLHALARGVQFEVFSIAQDVVHQQLVALTGPIIDDGRHAVWATDLPNWKAHQVTGGPVHVTVIPLDRIMMSATRDH